MSDDGGSDEEWATNFVGYLEDPPSAEESKLLTRRNFPSKVGGKPAWLVPQGLPDIVCKKCDRPMRFLLQSYASRGWANPAAFHRALHVFVCTSCQPNEVRVYRAQLPRENPFYSADAPVQEQILAQAHSDPELEPIICWDCGLPCRAVSRDAEVEEVGAVANRCDECARRFRNNDGAAMFEERELTSHEAEEPDSDDDEDDAIGDDDGKKDADAGFDESGDAGYSQVEAEANASLAASMPAQGADDAELLVKLQEYRDRVKEDPTNALEVSEAKYFEEWSKEKGIKDNAFSKLQEFSRANPKHVIRHEFGGKPLWFCEPEQLQHTPPVCGSCGGPRVFELQVQPQIISLLSDGPQSELGKRLDFGVVCVFVCEKSCQPPESAPYSEEFVHVQAEPQEAWLPKE